MEISPVKRLCKPNQRKFHFLLEQGTIVPAAFATAGRVDEDSYRRPLPPRLPFGAPDGLPPRFPPGPAARAPGPLGLPAVRPLAVRPLAVRPLAGRPLAGRPLAGRPLAGRPLGVRLPKPVDSPEPEEPLE